ncbi:von Willebrand factor type A domain-containing protein [Luteolibacter arcticus]|uniref:von Willebrand factor type A domain-containing protein n=1 Tax=Luteolibacter arcticus TaxID=1581411 RepID=A0ABT3GRV1_9BACT|nr:von Willebrand factor type A domain-containing protein [Luteolibacter arcticus]MCW1926201.1 von Willebrand factor type A domain-containing protein [Luteolibacter arcticus]
MNDDTDKPLNPVGDAALEARLTAWVLGEASPFEAAELEEICARDPEVRLFERRLRVLHGFITADRKAGADDEWKLPAEKRAKIEALFEEPVVLTEDDREKEKVGVRYVRKPVPPRQTGRRALLALAACTVVSLSGWALMSSVGRTSKDALAMETKAEFSAKAPSRESKERALEELRKAVIAQEDAVEDKRKLLSQIIRTEGVIYSGEKSAFQGSRGFDGADDAESASRAYTQLEQDKIQLESQIETLLKYDGDQLLSYASGIDLPDNIVPVLRPQLEEAKREHQSLKRQGLAENDPKMRASSQMIDGMEKDVADSVSNLRETLKAKVALSNEQLASLKGKENEGMKSGIAVQSVVDAKGDFEASQRLLEQLKVKLITEELQAKISGDAIALNEPDSPVLPLAPTAKSRKPTPPMATPAPAAEPAPPMDSPEVFTAKSDREQAADESLAQLADGGTVRSKSSPAGPPVKKPVTSHMHLSQNSPFSTKSALAAEARHDMPLPQAAASAPATPAVTGAIASKELAEQEEAAPRLTATRDGKPANMDAGGPEWFGRSSKATPSGEGSDLQTRFRSDASAADVERQTGEGLAFNSSLLSNPTGGPAAGDRPMDDPFATDGPAQPASRPATATADQAFASGGAAGAGQSPTKTDFIGDGAGVTIPGVPADPSADVTDIVTAGNRSGLGAVNRNSIDAILNNTDRSGTNALASGKDLSLGLDGGATNAPAKSDLEAAGKEVPLVGAFNLNATDQSVWRSWLTQDEGTKGPEGFGTTAPPSVNGFIETDARQKSATVDFSNLEGMADLAATTPLGSNFDIQSRFRGELSKNLGNAKLGGELYYSDAQDAVLPGEALIGGLNFDLATRGEGSENDRQVPRFGMNLRLGSERSNFGPRDEEVTSGIGGLGDLAKKQELNELEGGKDDLSKFAKSTGNPEELVPRLEKAIREGEERLQRDPNSPEIQHQLQQLGKVREDLRLEITKAKGAKVEQQQDEAPSPVLLAETLTSAEPFSTFSLHVSDASFKMAKAALDRGEVPAADSIRPEEFYNAFDYGDPAPATGEPVVCAVEQAAHPALPQRNLLRIGVRTGSQGRGGSTPLNLTLLLDSSGSMEREDRNAGLANAVQQLSGLLKDGDTVSVIGFARQPRLLVDRLPGNRAQELNAIFAQTPPEGGTNLEEGIKLAEQLALRQFNPAAQNRIVLFTDGAANLGDAKPETLQTKVEQMRQNGIAFDAAGFGTDGLNDKLLERLTRNGNGRYYIVDRAEDADASFAKQLAGAFRPAAENVKVQVRFNPARVAKYKLIGFEEHRLKKEDFRNDAVDAAEMAAEEAGNALYQIEALPQGEGEVGEVSVRFRDVASGQMVERTWTIPYEAQAPAFDQAAPAIQLAGLAAFAAEKLRAAPLADAVDFQQLAPVMAKVRARYGSSKPVAELEAMIGKLK